ncbi:unnamed protein product [Owenia fusiformis]|uniref:Uncharacterized protein n=1 Tax=Owenia fusiformis TaxID=6347 RepID=A0A8J1TY38_OWEFU|nr:unnamed protein product [Owenia fusiformis]
MSVAPVDTTDTIKNYDDNDLGLAECYDLNDDKDIFQQSSLFQAMKPLLWSLKLCGLYHERQWRVKNGKGDLEEIGKVTPSRIWSIVSMIVQWLNFGKIMLAFLRDNEFGSGLMIKVMVMMWHLNCGISCIVMYRCWAKPENLPGLIYKWEKLCKQDTEDTLQKFKRLVKIGLFFSWGLTIMNFVFFVYFLFNNDIFHVVMVPFEKDVQGLLIVKIVFVVVSGTLVNMSCTFPSLTHIAVTWLLNEEFKKFNKQFKDSISECHGLEGSIESHRKRHMDICQLTGFADEAFKCYHASAIGIPITVTLIIIYNIMNLDRIRTDSFLTMTMVFWLLMNLFIMIEALLMCAIVNSTAHDSYDDVHSLDLQYMDQKEVLQVSIFLNKLSGHPDQIGLKVACLFIIDGPTILTVFGLLLSYFFLLISFKPASPESVLADCNCTISI